MDDLSKIYGIQTNLLEYGAIRNSITRYLKSTKSVGKTYTKEVGPVNTFLNTIINLDVKGVRKLYRIKNSGKTYMITDIAPKWKNETGEIFTNDEIEHAFTINHKYNDNMYMKYIQYRF